MDTLTAAIARFRRMLRCLSAAGRKHRLLRWVVAPFRLLFRFVYWFNYGYADVYKSDDAKDANRVPTRPISQSELGRTTRQIGNAAGSEHRIRDPRH